MKWFTRIYEWYLDSYYVEVRKRYVYWYTRDMSHGVVVIYRKYSTWVIFMKKYEIRFNIQFNIGISIICKVRKINEDTYDYVLK